MRDLKILAAIAVGAGTLATLGACGASPQATFPGPNGEPSVAATTAPPLGRKNGKWRVGKLEMQAPADAADKPPYVPRPDPTTTPGQTPAPDKPVGANPHGVGAAETTSASGHLSNDSVENSLATAEDSLGTCVEGTSTFAARLIVAPNGHVVEAHVTQSSPDDPRLRDCLVEVLRHVQFDNSTAAVPLAFSLTIEPNF